jgi:hypothetical protein
MEMYGTGDKVHVFLTSAPDVGERLIDYPADDSSARYVPKRVWMQHRKEK